MLRDAMGIFLGNAAKIIDTVCLSNDIVKHEVCCRSVDNAAWANRSSITVKLKYKRDTKIAVWVGPMRERFYPPRRRIRRD
jgi:hypothetical protein